MKSFLLTTSAMLVMTPALARDTVIAIPGTLPVAAKHELVKSTVTHVLETVAPGERAHFFDASTTELIAVFDMPEGAKYAHPRAKAARNAQAMGQLKAFMDAPEGYTWGQVNIPAVLNAIGAALPAGDGADLILLASPLNVDVLAPSLSMGDGAVPGDGHIHADLSQSPYGSQNLDAQLAGYDVYFGLVDPLWAQSTAHAHAVERFWTLSVQQRGGVMQMFSPDVTMLLSSAGEDRPAPVVTYELVPTDKLEIIRFSRDLGEEDVLYTAAPELAPAPEPLWTEASDVSIGISWDCTRCDLDLYVRPSPTANVIYFGNTDDPLGQLRKDHLSSPSLTNGYETVSLNRVVDLEGVQIAMNHYSGDASGPVTVELRIAIGDQVWAQDVVLSAGKGNRGDGSQSALVDQIVPNEAWALVDPLTVVGAP